MNYIKIIKNYDFARAEFDKLPSDIFEVNLKNLSKMDRAVLDGIKYQMTISKYNGIYQSTKQYITDSVFHIQYSIFNIRYSLLDIRHSIFNIRYSSPDIRHSIFHIRYSIFDIQHSLPRFALAGATFAVAGFFLLSLTYYANVNLNLGLKFLTDLFA